MFSTNYSTDNFCCYYRDIGKLVKGRDIDIQLVVNMFLTGFDKNLKAITPTVDSVDDLLTEEDEAKFILAFREIVRLKNVLECFTQCTFVDLPMDEQLFADCRSK